MSTDSCYFVDTVDTRALYNRYILMGNLTTCGCVFLLMLGDHHKGVTRFFEAIHRQKMSTKHDHIRLYWPELMSDPDVRKQEYLTAELELAHAEGRNLTFIQVRSAWFGSTLVSRLHACQVLSVIHVLVW